MKITNMNAWLPKPYFPVFLDGKHLGNFETQEEAEQEYEAALIARNPPKMTIEDYLLIRKLTI